MPAQQPSNQQPPIIQDLPFTPLGLVRSIPWLVRVRLLFGGSFNQFGWLWLAFSMIFAFVFVRDADLGQFVFNRGPVATAQGIVTAVDETSSSENEQTVYAIAYRFYLPGQEDAIYQRSYSTDDYTVGQKVPVEYRVDNPATSRIEGTRQAPFGAGALIVLIFPLIGLVFIATGLIKGITALRLLAHGQMSLGRLVAKTPTSTRINDRRVYALTFLFTTSSGAEQTVVTKTHLPEALEDEAHERVLYNPSNPNDALLFDLIPGYPQFDQLGRIQPGGLFQTALVLLLPTLTCLELAAMVVYWR